MIPEPPTELEIAEVIRTLMAAGLKFMADHVRGLAAERDRLKRDSIGAEKNLLEGMARTACNCNGHCGCSLASRMLNDLKKRTQ